MTQPLVSVVMPVYKVEKYLDRCVASVVDQTYPNLQIILVDDGSPDRCPAMCDEWAKKDSRVSVIHKKNAGAGIARNAGMDAAEGKYIFFFDSDDYVDAATVEKCVASAEKHGADAVIYGRSDVYEDGRVQKTPIHAPKYLFQGDEIRSDLLPKLLTYELGFGVGSWGRMYRLQTLTENNIRFVSERELTSEDAFFALKFFGEASVVTIVPEHFYFYFRRNDSQSRAYVQDRQEKNNRFLQTCLSYIQETGIPEAAAAHVKVRYHFYTIAAMKQVIAAELSGEEKKKVLREIFHSPVLRRTLTADVLKIEKPSQKLFFALLKMRCDTLCYLMLQYKMRKY